MPTVYQTPGVYMNEVPPQSRPIEGVATSVAAFVGLAPAGPANTPVRITSWTEFARKFSANQKDGPFMAGAYLAYAVQGFFANGGTLCWVVRIGEDLFGGVPQAAIPAASGQGEAFRFVLREELEVDGKKVEGEVEVTLDEEPLPKQEKPADKDAPEPASPTQTYKITVTPPKEVGEPWERGGLTAVPGPNYIATVVNAEQTLIDVMETSRIATVAERVPKAATYKLEPPPEPPKPVANDLNGAEETGTGLAGLAMAEEITMVAVPDLMALQGGPDDIKNVQGELIDFCTKGKRMAILDPPPGYSATEVGEWRAQMPVANEFTTLYWPWIQVPDPLNAGKPILVPPSGHIAGSWAGTDERRGIHKAPANEDLMNVVGLAAEINDAGQGALNQAGINCIRSFRGHGIRSWGARTLSSEAEWRYINVRRLFNYVSASLLRGTQWAVFEPNDETLWGRLNVSVSNFLTGVWRGGALFGSTPDEAFFVKCDAETNPEDLIEAGQVNILVGIAPVKPAEFVIFQISQFQKPQKGA